MGQYDIGAIVSVLGCHDLRFSIQHDMSLQRSGILEECKSLSTNDCEFPFNPRKIQKKL